jgi:hypothetical protein
MRRVAASRKASRCAKSKLAAIGRIRNNSDADAVSFPNKSELNRRGLRAVSLESLGR